MPSSYLPPHHHLFLQTLSPSSNAQWSGCGGVGASQHRPAVIQAAAEDALAGGPDQWAADSAHKAEAVRKGERDLWRIQFKTSLWVSPSQLWRSDVAAHASRLFSQTVAIELAEGREACCFFSFFFFWWMRELQWGARHSFQHVVQAHLPLTPLCFLSAPVKLI